MNGKIQNILTGEIIPVHSTTEHADSSYGLPVWVDEAGRSYGQCMYSDIILPRLGFRLVDGRGDYLLQTDTTGEE